MRKYNRVEFHPEILYRSHHRRPQERAILRKGWKNLPSDFRGLRDRFALEPREQHRWSTRRRRKKKCAKNLRTNFSEICAKLGKLATKIQTTAIPFVLNDLESDALDRDRLKKKTKPRA
jgi:hypothetical protein